jgi:hypothetical protein
VQPQRLLRGDAPVHRVVHFRHVTVDDQDLAFAP